MGAKRLSTESCLTEIGAFPSEAYSLPIDLSSVQSGQSMSEEMPKEELI